MNISPAWSSRYILQVLTGPKPRQIFKGIYNNFLLTAEGTRQKSLLVCASNQGEGASTVALGLAIAAAEVQNQTVLLIDGNFTHPQVCAAFGLPEVYGLGDYLAGRIDLKSAVKATPISDLHVMGAGVAPLNHVSILESPAFSNLLEKLAVAYPFIIIDGPAINVFPESVVYATQVNRVFLVVHSGVTRVQVVSTALAKLAAGGCDKVDLILNRRTFPIPIGIYKRL